MYRCRANFVNVFRVDIYGFTVVCVVYDRYSVSALQPQAVTNSK
jgi:hypothetical protein